MADADSILWILIPLAVLLTLLALLVLLPIILRRYCATCWHDMMCYECCEGTVFCMECCRSCECDCGGEVTEDYPVATANKYNPVNQGDYRRGTPSYRSAVSQQPSHQITPNITMQQQSTPHASRPPSQQTSPRQIDEGVPQMPTSILTNGRNQMVERSPQSGDSVRMPYGWHTPSHTPYNLDAPVPLLEKDFGRRPPPPFDSYEQPRRDSDRIISASPVTSPTREAHNIYVETPVDDAPDRPTTLTSMCEMPLVPEGGGGSNSGIPLTNTTSQRGVMGNMAWSLQQQVTVGGTRMEEGHKQMYGQVMRVTRHEEKKTITRIPQ